MNRNHITPDELLAIATGDTDSRAADHIAQCATCAAEVDAYASADHTLRRALFRIDCPSTQILGELALGLLGPNDVLAVRSHLVLCHHCGEELAALSTALSSDPMEDLIPIPSPLRRILARLLPPPVTEPAYAVRGASAPTASTYEAEGLTISVTIRPEGAQPAPLWTLLGMMMDEAGDTPPVGTVIRLLQDGRDRAETTLDEWGHVAFAGLESGTYTVELDLPDRVIAIEDIQVGTS